MSKLATTLLIQLQNRGKGKDACFLSIARLSEASTNPSFLPSFFPFFFLFHAFSQIHVTTHVTGHASTAAHWLLILHPFLPTSFFRGLLSSFLCAFTATFKYDHVDSHPAMRLPRTTPCLNSRLSSHQQSQCFTCALITRDILYYSCSAPSDRRRLS